MVLGVNFRLEITLLNKLYLVLYLNYVVAVCVMCLFLTVVKSPSFPEQFKKFIKRYDEVIYNTHIIQHIA